MFRAIVLNGAFIWGGNFTTAFASGFVGGAITTGSLKGALIGGATALAFYGGGSAFPSASKLRGAAPWKKGRLWFGKIVAHGTVGGASSAAQGGSFQDGFRSAGFTQLAAPVIGSVPGDAVGRTAAAAVVGGTASRLGGGKFANGATTGAFSYLFNDCAHDPECFASGRVERDTSIETVASTVFGVVSLPFRGIFLGARSLLGLRPLAANIDQIIKPAGRLIGEAGSSSRIRIVSGSAGDAKKMFNALSVGGRNITPKGSAGNLVELSNGREFVGFRPTSASGLPTIDVNISGFGIREIKFK